MASPSRDNRDDTACDKCGAPASWADTNTSNLSWNQGVQAFLDAYCLSPRMWPIGYIVRSPYSPLRLEVEMPKQTKWRDAFEDLLALESGGQMISLERRKKEAELAKRQWHSRVSQEISIINKEIKYGAKYLSLMKRAHDVAARKQLTEVFDDLSSSIPAREADLNQSIANGRNIKKNFEERVGESLPASAYKMKGQWMVSLVSSGALPDWFGQVLDSSDGYQVSLSKTERNLDDNERDGLSMTEAELNKQFNEGIPIQLGGPSWSTSDGSYPEPQMASAEVQRAIGVVQFHHRSSILSQLIAVERTKSGKQDLPSKVVLTTVFTDGACEVKEVVDDCCKIMEENERVYDSMHARNFAIFRAREYLRFNLLRKFLKETEETIELDHEQFD